MFVVATPLLQTNIGKKIPDKLHISEKFEII